MYNPVSHIYIISFFLLELWMPVITSAVVLIFSILTLMHHVSNYREQEGMNRTKRLLTEDGWMEEGMLNA